MEEMKRQLEYFYLPLADAIKSIGVKVNLFALVHNVAPPYLTSSSDLVLKLKVLDPSYPALGVTVMCSADTKTKLPNVNLPGDIISLHRVMMILRDGEYYCVYDKKRSSFALFEGTTNENLVPYQTSENYNTTDHDTVFLKQMREWSSERLTYEVLTEHPLKMNRINPCAIFDLTCKVLHVSKTSANQVVLYVWDGTDAPPGLQFIMSCREQQSTPPVPLQLEEIPLPRDILCSFPCVGTILRVFSSKNFAEISKLRDHDRPWVRLCNITCTMHFSGIWEGSLQPFSKIQILSNQDNFVIDCLREYNSRIDQPYGRFPWMCHPLFSSITVTDHPSMGYSTLMDSLTNTKGASSFLWDPPAIETMAAACHHNYGSGYEFLSTWEMRVQNTVEVKEPRETSEHLIKAIVRVVGVYPSEFPYKGQDEVCLTLEDPTARVHAFLTREAAEQFFGVQSAEPTINRRMKTLLGVHECETEEGSIIMHDPPWSVFCLKSCFVQTGSSRSQKYRIQDTML